jgi:hypothetical protein
MKSWLVLFVAVVRPTERNARRRVREQPVCVYVGDLELSGKGPDEIAHFLRIYSYARGELLPGTEINVRKGIFVSPGLPCREGRRGPFQGKFCPQGLGTSP